MDGPDFIICIECETPCYTFEWKRNEIQEALCEACGNDDLDVFATAEDWEAMGSDWERKKTSARTTDRGGGTGGGRR